MIKHFLTCVFLANASFVLAQPRIVAARGEGPQSSLEQLTATLLGNAGARGADLASVAAERGERLRRLIETDPARVLRLAVSPAFRATLPSTIRDFVEERVEMEGTLEVLVEDRSDGSRMLFSMNADSGQRFALSFASQEPQLLTGGQTWLDFDVFGWYTLPIANTNCPTYQIEQYADQAANDAGINVSTYRRRIYIFRANPACPFSGQGERGGSPTSTWISGTDYGLVRGIVNHEVGHNLGLYHSHSLSCPPTVLEPPCTTQEYGDAVDAMGGSGAHYNAFQKQRLGWLDLPVFDGANIWVPNQGSASVSVVRASTGAVLATLTAGTMVAPRTAAFDGQRVLVTAANNLVFLWKAADLTPLGSLLTDSPTDPYGVCSDGFNFWIAFHGSNQIARF